MDTVIPDLLGNFAGALTTITQPTTAWVWVVVVVGSVLIATMLRRRRAGRPGDPRRLYTPAERQAGFSRAGGQCEFDHFLFVRCTRTASHGDHFFPWSKGGATSMRNFVAGCSTCNTSKGARQPTAWQRRRIQMRRRGYFPAGVPLDAGEWFR